MSRALFDIEALTALGLKKTSLAADTRIFVAGDDANCMFVVAEGQINIISHGTIVDNVRKGDIFGEMALIDDKPRSATAITGDEQAAVLEINKATFCKLVQKEPDFALRVMQRLAERLRAMNEGQ